MSLLTLGSCVNVADFGAYWDKAGIDPHLAGRWKRVAADPEQTRESGYRIGDIMRMTRRRDGYEMATDPNKSPQDDTPIYPIKTLAIGPYQFLAMRPDGDKGGIIWRYQLKGGTLELCTPSLDDFVMSHYPNAVNIRNGGDGPTSIVLLDDEVSLILSQVPDTETFWSCDTKYQRVP